ncbi:ATP-binding protein [Streptomyces durbertensis]|uniref:ATP-binding protein n=1 Tax=Streptomyces durbertensis TaxID=2448886 RepID=A0ABR6EDW5_9ACTN|nr:ATP-binding protein [Streptomyces durbertensis]MBB1243526.1 ATP-binding protein [Streptomyces durbertensis]
MNVTTSQQSDTVHTFAQLLSSTRRGARLARLLVSTQLAVWDLSPHVTGRAEQIAAELAANAALHGRVRGRDFRLSLALDSASGVLRVAVTDARGDRLPAKAVSAADDDESGRGLVLVAALADRWGTEPHPPGGKTVWAECDLAPAVGESGWHAGRDGDRG